MFSTEIYCPYLFKFWFGSKDHASQFKMSVSKELLIQEAMTHQNKIIIHTNHILVVIATANHLQPEIYFSFKFVPRFYVSY